MIRIGTLQNIGLTNPDLNRVAFSVYRELRSSIGPARARRVLQEIQAQGMLCPPTLDGFPGDVRPEIDEVLIRRAGRLGAILGIEPDHRGLVSPRLGVDNADRLLEHAYIGTVGSLSLSGVKGEDVFNHPAYINARLSILGEANQRFCRDDEE